MAKFEIPRFRYLTQDGNGEIWMHVELPYTGDNKKEWYCSGGSEMIKHYSEAKFNPNWRDTLIDLDVDDYDFEDGILRRIEK